MKGRTVAQIRSFLHVDRRKQEKNNEQDSVNNSTKNTSIRNTIPLIYYKHFRKEITNKETPTIKAICNALQSPSFQKYSVEAIKEIVQRAQELDGDN